MKLQKLLKTAVFSLFVLAAGAAEKSLDSSWWLNRWDGYKPFAKLEKGDEGVHLSSVESKYGAGLNSPKQIPAKAGDQAVFRAQVKGTGTLSFQLQNWSEKGQWLAVGSNTARVELTPEWKEVRLTVPVKNQKKGNTGRISGMISIGCGGELWFRESSVSVESKPAEQSADANKTN